MLIIEGDGDRDTLIINAWNKIDGEIRVKDMRNLTFVILKLPKTSM